MTIRDEILEELEDSIGFTASIAELTERIKRNRGSIRSAASRATKRGFLERTSRGVYRLLTIYYKIRATKTSEYDNKDKGNIEVDANLEGWVSRDVIDIIARTLTKKVKDNTNDQLVDQIIEVIEDNFNLLDASEVIKIKKRGWEILDRDHNFVRNSYNRSWSYQIFVTAGMNEYDYKGERIIEERNLY